MTTTDNGFLGGRLRLLQPRDGYRAGADPVLLAASVRASAGESVLELGCGVGTALFCLGARVPGLSLTGVERQPDLARLAVRNAERNGIAARIVGADLAALPPELKATAFDHVMFNPPFFTGGTAADDAGRAAGRHVETPLAVWVETALRRLRPGGGLYLIARVAQVPELISLADGPAGAIELVPLAPRRGREARLAILMARKGRRGPFRLHPPLVLHDGDRHLGDGDDHSAAATAILRDGASLEQARSGHM